VAYYVFRRPWFPRARRRLAVEKGLVINRVNAVRTRAQTFAGNIVGIKVSNFRLPRRRTIRLSHNDLTIGRTNAPRSRTISFTADVALGVARTNPARSRVTVFRIPPERLRDITFTAGIALGVSRTNLPRTRRIQLATGSTIRLGPFYTCTCGPSDTTFGPQFLFNSFDFVKAIIKGAEGQKPTLTLTVRNPRQGLIAVGTLQWLWLSWVDIGVNGVPQVPGGSLNQVYNLFYGHLVGVPIGLRGETIDLEYISDPNDVVFQKQQIAEALKVAPFYDAAFLDDAHRDDPDSILEGYTKSYHYPRLALPNSVSVSDWTVGEDGTITFNDVPYSSLKEVRGQPPLVAVNCEAEVVWQQISRGIIKVGDFKFNTFCGKGLIGSWPEVGKALGGGYRMHSGFAFDVNGVDTSTTVTRTANYSNPEPQHSDGDTMSIDASITVPTCPGPLATYPLTIFSQSGFIDPDTGLNIPSIIRQTYLHVAEYGVAASMTLGYDSDRSFSESINFTMLADVQPVLVRTQTSLAQIETELILKKNINVGRPLPNVLNWTSIAGKPITAAVIVFPNNPAVAGGQSFQLYPPGGTTGTTEPAFSDVVGETTADGTATAISMGESPNLEPQNWSPYLQVPEGAITAPNFPDSIVYSDLVAFGKSQFPKIGTAVTTAAIISNGGNYYYCTQDGVTNPNGSGPPSADGDIVWALIGASLPAGTTYFLATQGGQIGISPPNFGGISIGGSVSDGGVVWLNIGSLGDTLGIPIGGTVGNVTARSYWDTARGIVSREYLQSLCEAKLAWRARMVNVSADCTWEEAIFLDCRHNGTINEDRLPGGTATGKIIAYEIRCEPNRALMNGNVTIGCTIGNGGSGVTGLETPTFTPFDDGIVFPLAAVPAVVNTTHGSPADELAAIGTYLAPTIRSAQLSSAQLGSLSIAQQIAFFQEQQSLETLMNGKNVWFDLQLKPVAGSTFSGNHNLGMPVKKLPKTIDLQATS
jgi:hypothetical protein